MHFRGLALVLLLFQLSQSVTCDVYNQLAGNSGFIRQTIPNNTYVCFATTNISAVFQFHRFGNQTIYVYRQSAQNGNATYVTTIDQYNQIGAFSFGRKFYGLLSIVSPIEEEVAFSYHTFPRTCGQIETTNSPNATYSLPTSSVSINDDLKYCIFFGFEGNGSVYINTSNLYTDDMIYYYHGYVGYSQTHNTVFVVPAYESDPFMGLIMSTLTISESSFYLAVQNANMVPEVITSGTFDSYSMMSYICVNGTTGILSSNTFSSYDSALTYCLVGGGAVFLLATLAAITIKKRGCGKGGDEGSIHLNDGSADRP